MSITSARREIERELAEIERRRAKLEAALTALAEIDGTPARASAAGRAARSRATANSSRPRPRAPRGETARRIIEHLRAHPEDRGTAIAAALGLQRANVNNTLTALKRSGRLQQDGARLIVVD